MRSVPVAVALVAGACGGDTPSQVDSSTPPVFLGLRPPTSSSMS